MGGSAKQPDWNALQTRIGDAAGQQTAANRPAINTPWASQSWDKDAAGNWTQNNGFANTGGTDMFGLPTQGTGPGLGTAVEGLQRQASAFGGPVDWGQFGVAGDGSGAQDETTAAAFGQAASRLTPAWDRREESQRTQLLNQGLDQTSEAYGSSMGDLNNARTDDFNSAMFSAIGQGQSAGDSAFQNNTMARQQAIADFLRQRSQPVDELGRIQSLMGTPQFSQDSSTLAGATGQANIAGQVTAQEQAELDAQQAAMSGGLSAGASVAASLLPWLFTLSDENAKYDIRRLGSEALPGVPWAVFRYRLGLGAVGWHFGVIAQDLERVRPDLVRIRPDGFREVNYGGLS